MDGLAEFRVKESVVTKASDKTMPPASKKARRTRVPDANVDCSLPPPGCENALREHSGKQISDCVAILNQAFPAVVGADGAVVLPKLGGDELERLPKAWKKSRPNMGFLQSELRAATMRISRIKELIVVARSYITADERHRERVKPQWTKGDAEKIAGWKFWSKSSPLASSERRI